MYLCIVQNSYTGDNITPISYAIDQNVRREKVDSNTVPSATSTKGPGQLVLGQIQGHY